MPLSGDHAEELLVLTLLLTVACKWSALDPIRIQDGPSWPWAAFGALYSTGTFAIALLVKPEHPDWAAFLGATAFGAGIGPCFLTHFREAPAGITNPVLRWWIAKGNGAADSAYKSILILPAAWIVSHLFGIDGAYWMTVLLALCLVSWKVPIAILSNHPEVPDGLADRRARVLIAGNVIVTSILGVGCLLAWCLYVKRVHDELGRFGLQNYENAIGFVLGTFLHIF